jgi:hypothetical protein
MFRHGVTVNVLGNNVATLYGRSGGGGVCLFSYIYSFLSIPFIYLISFQSQGVFKSRIGSRSEAQFNNSGLNSVCIFRSVNTYIDCIVWTVLVRLSHRLINDFFSFKGSYFDGLRSLTQKLQSWYFGRPLVR